MELDVISKEAKGKLNRFLINNHPLFGEDKLYLETVTSELIHVTHHKHMDFTVGRLRRVFRMIKQWCLDNNYVTGYIFVGAYGARFDEIL